jgi:hypothetical protein
MTAQIIPFPLKPQTEGALTFWFVAGDIIWRGQPISVWQAQNLRETYEAEAKACWLGRDIAAARRSAKLWGELTRALDALDLHCRIVGRPLRDETQRRGL